nr:unnamed protein product [Naegleria fowleri]
MMKDEIERRSNILLEMCMDESTFDLALESVRENKCQRLEVCSELGAEGFTPHEEMVLACLSEPLFEHTNLNIMIRPKLHTKFGTSAASSNTMIDSFCYNDEAIAIMKTQIRKMKKLLMQEKDKVKNRQIGFVLGCIERRMNGKITINVNALKELIGVIQEPCKDLHHTQHRFSITFHKAFDLLSDQIESVTILAELGIDRILTSLNFECEDLKGKAVNSIQQFMNDNDNTELLQRFLKTVSDVPDTSKVILLIGGGVRENNYLEIMQFFELFPKVQFELHSSTPFKIK